MLDSSELIEYFELLEFSWNIIELFPNLKSGIHKIPSDDILRITKWLESQKDWENIIHFKDYPMVFSKLLVKKKLFKLEKIKLFHIYL